MYRVLISTLWTTYLRAFACVLYLYMKQINKKYMKAIQRYISYKWWYYTTTHEQKMKFIDSVLQKKK